MCIRDRADGLARGARKARDAGEFVSQREPAYERAGRSGTARGVGEIVAQQEQVDDCAGRAQAARGAEKIGLQREPITDERAGGVGARGETRRKRLYHLSLVMYDTRRKQL